MSATAPNETKSAILPVSCLESFRPVLILTTVAIIALGAAREVFVDLFGLGTALKDLRHISLDGELNIATWYSSTLMLAASFLALVCSRGDTDLRQRPYWLLIATAMLLMSIDETASIHESFITLLESWRGHSDYLHFSWVVLGIPATILFAAVMVPFLFRLERRTALTMILAGGLFVFGALVMEMIDGAIQVRLGSDSLAYRAGAAIEDCFELAGMTLFVLVLMKFAARMYSGDSDNRPATI